jgi:hypothetical protein
MRVAGLTQIQVPTIENVDVTALVPGHMAYRTAMPKLLREVGWEVESEEFSEIEDPDPENHEQRQRELIDEIEEARKELEKKAAEKEKRGSKISWWKRKKGDKKAWEVYDEHSQKPAAIDKDADPAKIAENHIMFDIDAIRKEVAVLAAESKPYDADERDFEIKEIKSTLPPMKIDLPPVIPQSPYSNLRETKSYNDSLGTTAPDTKATTPSTTTTTNGTHTPKKSFEEYDEFDDLGAGGQMEMTFDTSFREPSPSPAAVTSAAAIKSPLPPTSGTSSPWAQDSPPHNKSAMPVSTTSPPSWNNPPPPPPQSAQERPPLYTAKTAPHRTSLNGSGNSDPMHNAWADEFEDEDFGQEKEIKMSFM